ncbi:MAG: TetR-like C-terminal domain-containing protein, partial [Pseudomonadota bacterium]
MALAYLQFTQENRNLWNVLFEHHLEADASPGWYQEKLDGLMANIERALVPSMPGASDTEIRRAARVLWAGVHGITSLASANKLANVSTDGAQILIKDLVNTYEAGLGIRRKDGRSQLAEAS